MKTAKVTMPDGSVDKAETKSSCGCLTALAVAIVIGGPAAWFPLPLAILAYIVVGVLAIAAGANWVAQKRTRQATVQPPAPGSFDPSKVLRTIDGKWVSADGTHYYPAATATWAIPTAAPPPVVPLAPPPPPPAATA